MCRNNELRGQDIIKNARSLAKLRVEKRKPLEKLLNQEQLEAFEQLCNLTTRHTVKAVTKLPALSERYRDRKFEPQASKRQHRQHRQQIGSLTSRRKLLLSELNNFE